MVFLQNKLKKKSLGSKAGQKFRENYDFNRLWRIKEVQGRSERYAKYLDARKKRKLRDSLGIGEKVLILAERLRKKDAPDRLHKSTTENRPYFNRNRFFTINRPVQTSDKTYY